MKLSAKMSCAALALVVLSGPALADDAPQRQPGRWAHDYLGRAADPDVRFGTLPNGMRYAIMHNERPSDGVAMRLRIASGSLNERDEEQGLAHYLEHMAFRGSANIADGEVVRMLERQGLRFGPDTNAFTSHDETVYMFTFPHGDQTALDTGLTLFREIGERLKLDGAAVEAERGVILSEERARDTPGYRAIKASLGNSLAGTRIPQRWPIGLVDTIKAATPDRLRRYYSANYRPDNATLVIVGNIDPAKVEAAIKARFADWKPHGSPDTVDLGMPHPAHPTAEIASPGTPETLSLSWSRPRDFRAETEAVDREKLTDMVAMTMLNNRLADRASRPGAVYVAAQGQTIASLYGAASLSLFSITAAPERWQQALGAVTEEQRRIVAEPVSADDLKRAVTQLNTIFESAAANAATRQSAEIADALVSAANDDQLYTSPAQDLDIAKPILAKLTPADIAAAWPRLFAGAGPVLFRATQSAPVGTPALETALATAETAPLAAHTAEAAVTWPYTDFGAPSKVISQTRDAALGTTLVRFANGTRLLVKPTTFDKDRIAISVSLGQGRAGVPAPLVHAIWATGFAPIGGLGKLSGGDLRRWTQANGYTVGLTISADTRAFQLGGGTRPEDFRRQMALLAAAARDPGFRPELGDKLTAIAPMIPGQLNANPGAVFQRTLQQAETGDGVRYGSVPDDAAVAATRPADLPALLKDSLSGAADVVVVGQVSVDDAIAATAATFGAGPAHTPAPMITPVATMAPGEHIGLHTGRADQAYYGVYWHLPDQFSDARLAYTARVAAAVLQGRLIDTVREKLGLTYSPQTEAIASVQMRGLGFLGAVLETPPANFAAFRTVLDQQVRNLAAKPISPDELDRARRPLVEGRAKDMETNSFWSAWLPLVLRDPRVRAPVLETGAGLARVSAGDVQALFARLAAVKSPTVVISKAK